MRWLLRDIEDPLAEGAQQWPALPGYRDGREAVLAWRVWRVLSERGGARLTSPFAIGAEAPIAEFLWRPGVNLSSRWLCTSAGLSIGPHPRSSLCTCGFRAVRSITMARSVLQAARSMKACPDGMWRPAERPVPTPLAVALVRCWGHLASGALAADDYPHTNPRVAHGAGGPIAPD
jgi:hypothetical protein